MAGGITGTGTPVAAAGQVAQPWPSRAAAYYGLAVIILATMLNFFDAGVFGLMAQRIKVDFHLTDEELGFLIGPANVIFYVLVGIPMARLVDIYPRKIVLACGIAAIGGITALGGLAQSFKQLFVSRMLVGAGGSAHAPGAYSMLADYFPPLKLPRAIAFLQLGFIGGGTLGAYFGGKLISMATAWPVSHWHGPDHTRLAVGTDDGGRSGTCDRRAAAAGPGAETARSGSPGEASARQGGFARDWGAQGHVSAVVYRPGL